MGAFLLLSMAASLAVPLSPLQRLALTDLSLASSRGYHNEVGQVSSDAEQTRDSDGIVKTAKTAYCKYDAIRDVLAASRERSRAQGRNGCCQKASNYLSPHGPPTDSPWRQKK